MVDDDTKIQRVMNSLDNIKCPACKSLDVHWEKKDPDDDYVYIIAAFNYDWLVCNECGMKHLIQVIKPKHS